MDMDRLKSLGVCSESYKKIFSGPQELYPARVKALVDLMANRSRRGISTCLDEWRSYAAIDTAYDVDFQQTTPTMIRNILGRHWDNPKALEAAVAGYGLSIDTLFIKEDLPDGKGVGLVPNMPVFFGILIPLVKAYVTIRLAKIFNERNLSPLLPYKPLKETSRNRVLCDVITDIVETMSTQYGYPAVLKQAIQQMLKYGVALSFTYEEWDFQQQEEQDDNGFVKKVTIKEGLRYYLPHPTRMFYDPSYPLTTINSDTGVSWCGHWTVKPYGDILDKRDYWNKSRIFSGTNWFTHGHASYYFEEFFPCAMTEGFIQRFGKVGLKREDKVGWYTNSDRDQAVFQTEFYMKLVPKDWGLGQYEGAPTEKNPKGKLVKTYKYPVWHRFILAGDDTVLWAEPMAYTPSWFMGYQYDAQAWQQRSLGLETIPWQDLVGDLLNHIIDVAKQNLMNCTFYDENITDKADIEKLKKLGSRLYKGLNLVGFDPLLNQRAGVSLQNAFVPMRLDKQSIVELLQALPVVLNIMERVLQITAQEVGAAASHQQGKEEILQTGSASVNGVMFTASGVDEGCDAWKRQLFEAATAYKDTRFLAQVSADIPDLDQHIMELGFERRGLGKDKVLVAGTMDKLRLEGFAASNQGPGQAREKEVAQILMGVVGTISGQPMLAQKVGADNLLVLLEQAARFGGAPRDFKLPLPPPGQGGPDEIAPNIVQAIQAAQQATLQAIQEKIAQPAAQEMAADKQRLDALDAALKRLEPIFAAAQAQQEQAAALTAKVASDAQRKDFSAQKAEQRKDAALQAQLAREELKTAAEIKLKEEAAAAQANIKTAEAAHGASLATAKTAHDAALAQATAKAKPKGE